MRLLRCHVTSDQQADSNTLWADDIPAPPHVFHWATQPPVLCPVSVALPSFMPRLAFSTASLLCAPTPSLSPCRLPVRAAPLHPSPLPPPPHTHTHITLLPGWIQRQFCNMLDVTHVFNAGW